jgi:hypothetical protein
MSFLEFVTANKSDLLPFFVIGGAFLVAIVGILSSAITTSIRTRAREQTRREIAAYIAEGSMSPEQGERLLAAKDSD